MLTLSTEWSSAGLTITHVRGESHPSRWQPDVPLGRWDVVMPRRAAFRRRVGALEYVVDANTGFVRQPHRRASVAEFITTPVELVVLEVEPRIARQVASLGSMVGPINIDPQMALAHRLLLRDARSDGGEMSNRLLEAVGRCVGRAGPESRRAGRTSIARRRLVADTVELLHTSSADALRLAHVARRVGSSPSHLSRVFSEVTGTTMTVYRRRLRVHAVLDQLEAGEDDLAAIAAAAGFADHSHMTRTIIDLLGVSPSQLRSRLRPEQG